MIKNRKIPVKEVNELINGFWHHRLQNSVQDSFPVRHVWLLVHSPSVLFFSLMRICSTSYSLGMRTMKNWLLRMAIIFVMLVLALAI